ncbi:MAG TPA: hypothetical protein VE978_28290 [Chitinophagales bacterium]|nr:hypothetical protein [Chitinophagales bacterium]
MMRYFIAGTFLLFIAACLNPPDYSVIPAITLDSISTTDITANKDSLNFYISFTDGDGDIGSETDSNLFITDSRTGTRAGNKIPSITPDGKVKEISGQIVFTLSEIDSIPDGIKDSIYYYYTIQIADRAGNLSNEVNTPLIFEH